MILKDQLQHGAYYAGDCRNACLARWDAGRQVFTYWRHKFGTRRTESIPHPDDEARYDVFTPKHRVAVLDPADEIPLDE